MCKLSCSHITLYKNGELTRCRYLVVYEASQLSDVYSHHMYYRDMTCSGQEFVENTVDSNVSMVS